ncbi:MAG: type II toxin-antitoxin system Phd/YefM family antitoxin [Campylobacterota bacterium]
MKTITLEQANKDLLSHINYSLQTHDEVNIASESGAMIMLPQEDYESIMETVRLLADKKSLKALLDAHTQREQGLEPTSYSIEDVFSDL